MRSISSRVCALTLQLLCGGIPDGSKTTLS